MAGGPVELINAQGRDTKCLAARSWRGADESQWEYIDQHSVWPQKTYGLTVDCWAGYPKLSCKALERHFAPHDNTEFIVHFPNEVIPAHAIAKWLRNRGVLPPSAPRLQRKLVGRREIYPLGGNRPLNQRIDGSHR